MMWLISLNKKSLLYQNLDPMKKVNTDLHLCLHLLVYTPLISIYIEVNHTIGALADILKLDPSVMVNANGSSLDCALFLSTSLSLDTTSYAIARWVLMLHSVMVPINMLWSGSWKIIVVSGVLPPSLPGGHALATGCSLSTSDEKLNGIYLNS